jgi:hypothetical protein
MLSKDDWMKTAEYQAARVYGEKYARWFAFRRFAAGPLGILTLVGAFGFGAYWLWSHVSVPATPGRLPTAFWVLSAALVVGTFVAFRPSDKFRTAAGLLVRGVIVGLLWLGFITYAVTASL